MKPSPRSHSTTIQARPTKAMTADDARHWIVGSALVVTASYSLFFILAPALGFPGLQHYDKAVNLLEIVLPTFLGYLGSAAHFVFNDKIAQPAYITPEKTRLVGMLVRGPIYIFALSMTSALGAFGYSNRSGAPTVGTGMNIDALALLLSSSLGVLAVTTNVAVAYLFAAKSAERPVAGEDPNT